MVKKIGVATLLLIGVLAGAYLTAIGILVQRWDAAMLRFGQYPTASSYLWWLVSALGIALIVVCIRGGIRFFRRRPGGTHIR